MDPDLSIVFADDRRIRHVCTPVPEVNDTVRQLAERMFRVMYQEDGIGLAATQVGAPQRMLVIDTTSFDKPAREIIMINPEITWRSEETEAGDEGCLSIPSVRVEVERARAIAVNYLDYDGNPVTLEVSDWFARVVQHEVDHLNGVIMLDYVSRMRHQLLLKKMQKSILHAQRHPQTPGTLDR